MINAIIKLLVGSFAAGLIVGGVEISPYKKFLLGGAVAIYLVADFDESRS